MVLTVFGSHSRKVLADMNKKIDEKRMRRGVTVHDLRMTGFVVAYGNCLASRMHLRLSRGGDDVAARSVEEGGSCRVPELTLGGHERATGTKQETWQDRDAY